MTKRETRLLLVEDNPGDVRLFGEMLNDVGGDAELRVDRCENMKTCLERVVETSYDLVLLDLGLPDCQGMDTFQRLTERVGETPIVILSGLDDEATAIAAVQGGAEDFLPKDSLTPRLLARSVRYAIERHELKRRTRFLATHDSLTGAYNRHYFNETIKTEIARSQRYRHPIGFLMIDVDRFKEVNDRFGYQAGDRVLRQVAEFLREQGRSVDCIVRYGGDEFLIVLPETSRGAQAVAERIQQAEIRLDEPTVEDEFPITLSAGASYWDSGMERPIEAVVAEADAAMYAQKLKRAQRKGASGEEPG